MAKALTLTANQVELLKALPDDRFALPPGKLQASCEKLERMGYAKSSHMKAFHDYAKGLVEFRRGYQRTKAGREFLEAK